MKCVSVYRVFSALLLCVCSFQSLSAPCAATGDLSGSIFNDYNGNTTRGIVNIETGVADITVSVFSDDGSFNSCESTADGAFAIDPPSGGFPVRMEITIPADKDYLFSGVSGPTRLQFYTAAETDIDVGLLNPKEYCTSNPMVATNCFINGNPELNDGDAGTSSVADVLVGFPYNATGNTAATNNNYLAFGGEVGATWGLAFQRQSDTLFAAAVMKRHAGFAQLGPGGIYQVDMSDPAAPVASDFVDLAAAPYNIDFGVDNHDLPTSNPQTPTYDELVWDSVGKVSYGGMAFSDDETTIWTVNLFDRNLYEIPVGIPAVAPAVGDINAYPIPSPSCMDSSVNPAVPAPDDSRPWAVQYYQGMVYVGVVCSAQTSQLTDDMTATLYRFDPDNTAAGFTAVIDFALDYPRGNVSSNGAGTNTTAAEWFPWIEDFSDIPNPNQTFGQAIYPQPIFTDMAFDIDGSIIVTFVDRLGHQMGNDNYGTDTSDTEIHDVAVAGDILRVCFDGTDYTLEDNASCDGGLTETNGADGAGGGQGPGGGEWYWQDMYQVSNNQDAGTHEEITLGGVAHLPGSGQVMMSVFDPTNQVRSGGVRWYTNADGTSDRGYMIFDTDAGGGAATFGKGAGLGDVELMCPQAPLEIGNRLWCDADHDGIQDPSEGVAAGVTVSMQCGADLPISTITDANGQYYFSDAIYEGVNSSPIPRNASCSVTVDTTTAANNLALTNSCNGAQITIADNGGVGAGSDLRDSDGIDDGSGVVNVTFTTGFAGQSDHAIDFGFGAPIDLGDNPDPTYPTLLASNGAIHEIVPGLFLGACVDSELDGQPNPAAAGDDGAVGGTTLGTCATAGDDEDGISDIQNLFIGNNNASLDVTSTGACRLDGWIDFNQDGDFDDSGEQIFNNAVTVNGLNDDLSFAVPTGAAAGNTYARFRCSSAGGLTPTGLASDGEVEDYVVTVAPVFTLGDYVWFDTNQDGIQDAGEPGVNGVTAELFDNATCTGTAVDSEVTANGGTPAADGFYEFTGLASGDYCVAFSNIPAGYAISPANQGGNDSVDSDVNPATGQIQNIDLTSADPSNDMGISLDGSIGGLVWCESSTNANTVYDAGDGDTLLAGIQVTLYNDANCNVAVDGTDASTAVTQNTVNPAGTYLFDDLPVGPVGGETCYITEVDVNDVDLAACDNVITDDTSGSELDTDNPNDTTGNDFGFDENISLGDYVWYDNDQNGVQDINELGVNGITVNLYDNAACTGTAVDSEVTANGGTPAADGFYEFTELASGDYCVEFTGLPTGYVFTQQNTGDDVLDSDANTSSGQVVGIQLNDTDTTIDAGIYAAVGSVSGLLFCDTGPENGSYDIGEELEGVTATLERDLDCDDVGDVLVDSIDTDVNGSFEFTDLPVALTPTPPNLPVCYVMSYSQNDPQLGDCSIPITPETQTAELTVDDPDADSQVFGVVPRGMPVAVPLSRSAMVLLMVLMILSLLLMNRRQRQ